VNRIKELMLLWSSVFIYWCNVEHVYHPLKRLAWFVSEKNLRNFLESHDELIKVHFRLHVTFFNFGSPPRKTSKRRLVHIPLVYILLVVRLLGAIYPRYLLENDICISDRHSPMTYYRHVSKHPNEFGAAHVMCI
jgi:hypothetical protein